jgi:hypothetical protein
LEAPRSAAGRGLWGAPSMPWERSVVDLRPGSSGRQLQSM